MKHNLRMLKKLIRNDHFWASGVVFAGLLTGMSADIHAATVEGVNITTNTGETAAASLNNGARKNLSVILAMTDATEALSWDAATRTARLGKMKFGGAWPDWYLQMMADANKRAENSVVIGVSTWGEPRGAGLPPLIRLSGTIHSD